jgi:hypothetical protein
VALEVRKEDLHGCVVAAQKALDRGIVIFTPAAGMDEVQGHPVRPTYEVLEPLVEARKGAYSNDSGKWFGKMGHEVQMLSQRGPGSKNGHRPTLA